MQSNSNNSKPPYGTFIVLIIIVTGFIGAIWSGIGTFYSNGVLTALTPDLKILITIGALIVLILYSVFFFHQKNKDRNIAPEYASTAGDKALETTYKLSGGYYKIRAIGGVVGTVLAIGASLYFLYKGTTTQEGTGYFSFSAVTFLVALGAAINSWIYWKRSKSLSKGRFY